MVPQQPPTIRAPAWSAFVDEPTEVVRPCRVEELAFDPLREARVRHDRSRETRRAGGHALERTEARERSGPAVDSDDIDTGAREHASRLLRRRPVDRDEFLAERHLGDDRQIRGPSRLVDPEEQRVEVGECLEQEQVDATLEQAIELFTQGGPDRRLVMCGELARRRTERPDRSGDEHIPAGDIARLPGHLCGPTVERMGAARQPICRQAMPVRPERRGLDEFGTRLDVLAVNGSDQLGPGRRELIQTRPLGNAPRKEERAHSTVRKDRTAAESHPEAFALVHGAKPSRSPRERGPIDRPWAVELDQRILPIGWFDRRWRAVTDSKGRVSDPASRTG